MGFALAAATIVALAAATIIYFIKLFYRTYREFEARRRDLQDKLTAARERLVHDQSPKAKRAFVQASRDYYVAIGKGIDEDGEPTAYIEQRIANDLQEILLQSTTIIDEYYDKRTTVNIEKAVLKPSEDSPPEIQKGIMLAITSSPNGSATMPEIMTVVAASQENIDEILRKLMIKGLIKVTNRNDGSICYVLDDLT
jgi:hypothetical protein